MSSWFTSSKTYWTSVVRALQSCYWQTSLFE